jgi:hypothetical protein
MLKKLALLTMAAAITSQAQAQDWDWQVTPYLWAAGIDGGASIGPIDADVSIDFEDIVDVLRGGALLRAQAQTERHGFLGDLVYLRIKEEEARDTIGGFLELKLDTLIVEGAYFYRFSDTYALEVGVRYWDFETTLRPELLPQIVNDSSWTDAFIGFRSEVEIGPNWDWLFRANIGAGGADYAAGLQMDFRRRFANGNSLDLGLRILDFAYEDGAGLSAVDLDMSLQGLSIGYTFDL